MKRRLHLIWCVALLLAVAAVTAVCTRRARPRVLPPEECSEVYRHYADSPDVSAAYIKDYRVNDTLTLSATLLQAVTDTGWVMLQRDFGLPVIPKKYESMFYSDSNQISIRMVPKYDYSLPTDSILLNNDVIAIAFAKHTICVLSIENISQINAVIRDHLIKNF